MTEPGINSIPGWDAFTNCTARDTRARNAVNLGLDALFCPDISVKLPFCVHPMRYTDDEDDDSAIENIQPLHAKRAPLCQKQLQNHFMLPAPPPEPMLPPQQPIDHSAATELTMINAEHIFDCSPQTLDQGPLPTSAESVSTDSSAANLTQSAPASTVGATPPILMASQSTPPSAVQTPQGSSRSASGKGN